MASAYTYRTILHGACLLEGNHPKGSQWAKECPVLRREALQAQRPRKSMDEILDRKGY